MHIALKISPGKRVLITGRTGSGKTALMVFLLRLQQVPVVILDTKIEEKFESLPNVVILDGLEAYEKMDFSRFDFQPFIVVRPLEHESEPEALDDFLLMLYRRTRNVCIAVDELYSVHTSGRHGPGLQALLTRGRSRGQTLIMGAQRPSWISLFCLSESDYYGVFALQLMRDRKRMYEMSGESAMLNSLDEFHFLWYIVGQARLIGFSPIDLDALQPEVAAPKPEKFYFI